MNRRNKTVAWLIIMTMVLTIACGCGSGNEGKESESAKSTTAENSVAENTTAESTTESTAENTTAENTTTEENESTQAAASTTGRDVTVGKWVMNVFDFFFYDCYFYYEDGELVKIEIRFSKGGGDEDVEVMIYEGDSLPSSEYYGKTPEEIRDMLKDYGADSYNWQKWD